ncbi:helix-turn-helix domain-containing protein [Nocardia jiangxiensis]|uniref:Helix-turn-helix domain-containing protein n=1 Tax=Nocardia jiangxiensis TaxID=282685 RepID=A0ABW6SE68_9NOCA|nr:XRE family transcriptional regulator [Nocardia jiangxiensis]
MVGARLRTGRRNQGLTLRQLASKVGVSPQLLSQIENGKTLPSVATLKAVVTELGLTFDDVFVAMSSGSTDSSSPSATRRPAVSRKTDDSAGPVFRAGSYPVLQMTGGVTLSQLPTGVIGAAVESFVTTLPPGTASSTDGSLVRHNGAELCFVYEGTLMLKLGFETYDLNVGDVAAFDSTVPHVYVNNGEEPAKAMWMQTQALGYEQMVVDEQGEAAE